MGMSDGWLHGKYDLQGGKLKAILDPVKILADRLLLLRLLFLRLQKHCSSSDLANEPHFTDAATATLSSGAAYRLSKNPDQSSVGQVAYNTLFLMLTGIMQNFGKDKAHRPEQALYMALRRVDLLRLD